MSAIVARIRSQFSDARPARRAGLILLALAAFTVVGTSAWAYWTSIGHGTASATTGTLTAPGKPTGTLVPAGVSLSWDPSTISGGGTITYNVERRTPPGTTWVTACGAPVVGTTSCNDTPGSGVFVYRVTAAYGSWTAEGAESDTITVASAVATYFTVSAPSSAIAGTAFSFTVTAKTASHTTATGYVGTVHFTSSDGQADLPADYTFVTGDNGVRVFTDAATLKTAGSQTIIATDTTTASITGNTAINVTAAAATKFVFTSTPVSGAASSSATLGPITVQRQDQFNNPATPAAAETVNLASNSTGTTLFSATAGGSTVTSVSIGSGQSSASFYYGDTKAASPTITASGALTSATQTETITSAAVNKLVFTTAPSGNQPASSSATIGAYQVQQQDTFGNPVTAGSAVTVNLTSTSTGATKFFSLTSGGALGTAVTTVSIPSSGTTSGNFYYADTKAGTPILTAQAAGITNNGTTSPTVVAAATVPSGLGYVDKKTTTPDQVNGNTSPNTTVRATEVSGGSHVGQTYNATSTALGTFTIDVEAWDGSGGSSNHRTILYDVVAIDAFGNITQATQVSGSDNL